MLLNPWSSFQGRSTHVLCNLVQMPQADHGETLGRVCRARKDIWQAGGGALLGHPGLRDVGHERDPLGELLGGRWVPVHSISAFKCAQVTLSSSS